MDLNFCHNLRGKHIVYVLSCQPDADGREYRYVGMSRDIEKRMAQQFGIIDGAAQWCKVHKPLTVLEVRLCNNAEEAMIMENCLVSVHQAAVGWQACRGSRWNMSGLMKRPPPHFSGAPEYVSPRSEGSIPELPSELPALYEKSGRKRNSRGRAAKALLGVY